MLVFTVTLHVVTTLALIFFVLLHSGRGGGLSDMFGGSMGATAAGSTAVEKNLDRITIVLGTTFAFTTVAMSLMLGAN
jgi:preprotein translocase subunit SecG